jgi:hypothetical protein
MERVLPTIEAIAERYPERTVFPRFIAPQRPEDSPGRWRHYFERWRKATRQNRIVRDPDGTAASGRCQTGAIADGAGLAGSQRQSKHRHENQRTQRLDRKSYLCIPMLKANCFVAGIDLNQSGNGAKARRLDPS